MAFLAMCAGVVSVLARPGLLRHGRRDKPRVHRALLFRQVSGACLAHGCFVWPELCPARGRHPA
jgi:hypothetical protein